MALITLGANAITALPSGVGGKVLQVVQATKTASQSFTLGTGTLSDITGLSLSITPSSASNKILILFTVHFGQTGSSANPYIHIDRGGSNIFIGDTAGSRQRITAGVGAPGQTDYNLFNANQTFLDSPSTTSATTYKLRTGGYGSREFHINKQNVDSTENDSATSTLTLMEISA